MLLNSNLYLPPSHLILKHIKCYAVLSYASVQNLDFPQTKDTWKLAMTSIHANDVALADLCLFLEHHFLKCSMMRSAKSYLMSFVSLNSRILLNYLAALYSLHDWPFPSFSDSEQKSIPSLSTLQFAKRAFH